MHHNNLIAKIFAVIAILTFALGTGGSVIIMVEADVVIGLVTLVSVFVSGMLFLGLAEIIGLLQRIADSADNKPKVFTGDAGIVADIEAELPEL